MSRELVIYSDESDRRGIYYSNFYGGGLVRSQDHDEVRQRLDEALAEAAFGVSDELKWSKIGPHNLARASHVIDRLFEVVNDDLLKIRVMFRQNATEPTGLTRRERRDDYARLYLHFLGGAWGFGESGFDMNNTGVKFILDKIPASETDVSHFKQRVADLSTRDDWKKSGVSVAVNQVSDVDSRRHSILQCVDLVLGSVQFRLNDKYLAKPSGSTRRGKKTRAKNDLRKHILAHTCNLRPNFNFGVTTRGCAWRLPYRHWRYVPEQHRVIDSAYKPKSQKERSAKAST